MKLKCNALYTPEVLSGKRSASYLVYTTGTGFPPIIQGVPQAMKGIATVFLLALLTGTPAYSTFLHNH